MKLETVRAKLASGRCTFSVFDHRFAVYLDNGANRIQSKTREVYIMRLTFSKRKLSAALTTIAPYAPTSSTVSLFTGVFVDASETGVKFTATDNQTTIIHTITGFETHEVGQAVISLKELRTALKSASAKDEIEIASIPGGHSVQCTVAGTKLVVPGYDPDEYPSIEHKRIKGKTWRMPGAVWCAMMARTLPCASKEQTRYFLNGIRYVLDSDRSEFVATDGRTLAIARCAALKGMTEPRQFTVPYAAIKNMLRTYKKSEKLLVGICQGDLLYFNDGASVVITRPVDGDYPKYEQILPDESKRTHRMVLPRADMLRACQQAADVPCTIGRSKDEKTARFDFKGLRVEISAKSRESGAKVFTLVDAVQGNGELSLGLNPDYIIKALDTLDSEHVEMLLEDELSSIIIRPVGADHDANLNLVMPMRLCD